jgi:hypothetical protein
MANEDEKKHWRKPLLRSVGIALVILIVSYFTANVPFAFSFKEKQYHLFENLVGDCKVSDQDFRSATFVDVTYDKMLVDETEHYDDGICKVAITDRGRLLEFLKMMEGKDYKHIVLDLLFEKNESTAFDAELSAQLLKMRDVIVCKRVDDSGTVVKIINDSLESIARYCDYYEKKGSGGVQKYQYIQNGENSVALELYEKETGRRITEHGYLYFDGWRLCHNADLFLIHKSYDEAKEEGVLAQYTMGADLLCDSCYDSRTLFEDLSVSQKIIFVGVLEGVEDRHSTYNNEQPGTYLHYLAYSKLMEEKHIIHWWYWIPLFIVYTLIGLWIMYWREKKTTRLQRFLENHSIIQLISSFASYGFWLTVVAFVLFWACDMPYDQIVPSVFFAGLSSFMKFIKLSSFMKFIKMSRLMKFIQIPKKQ